MAENTTRKPLDRNAVAVGAVIIAIILFIAINILSNAALRTAQVDLTQDRRFTVSEATRGILTAIDEPITLKFYVSERVQSIPQLSTYATRVQELLQQYQQLGQGKLKLEVYNPQQFSPEEDQAVGFGITALPVSGAGDVIYFGLAGTNSTDDEDLIAFFSPEREPFLEYDLSKLVYNLSRPKKTTVALISSLPIAADPSRRYEPWVTYTQATQFFDIRTLGGNIKRLDEDVDLLLLVNPTGLADVTLYAIDQYLMRGGKALIFVDPHPEVNPGPPPRNPGEPYTPPANHSLGKLFAAYGVDVPLNQIVGDRIAAQRVAAMSGGRRVTTDYLPWLSMTSTFVKRDDVVTAEIQRLNMTSVGHIVLTEGSKLKLDPLVFSSEQAQLLPIDKVRPSPDPVTLLTDFKSDNKSYPIVGRLTGAINSAFPDGPPVDADNRLATGPDPELAKEHRKESVGPINMMLVADADLLADQIWIQNGVPAAQNNDLFVNLMDNLRGSAGLIALRGKGLSNRPFTLVQEIQRESELKFRSKERELLGKIEALQAKIVELQRKDSGGGEMLSKEQTDAVSEARREMVRDRAELREVQFALQQDVKSLDTRLKILNIGAIPLLIGIFAIGLWLVRRARFSRHVRTVRS